MSLVVRAGSTTSRVLAVALGFVLPAAFATSASAQQTGGAAPGGGAPAAAPAAAAPTITVTPGTTQYFPGGVAPVPAGGTLGGGNAQFSSSKPITGTETDKFDFGGGSGTGDSVHGEAGSSFVISGGNGGNAEHAFSGIVPPVHPVHKGDTLWGICDHYFDNPYQWPRIWSYNAQIKNPHWIYPGDQVKLHAGGGADNVAATAANEARTGGSIVDRRRTVAPNTVFLRNQGFVEDENSNWGEITGSREDKMFLTDHDEVYLRLGDKHDLKIGQELTVFRPLPAQAGGRLIEIQGTVRVDQWNEKDRIARARVVETLDTIERGARVGPIVRSFEVISPVRNEKDVKASVIASIQPHEFWGQNQVVFIDKGSENGGLVAGNRLFVIRKGDGFHMTEPTGTAAKRIAMEDPSPAAMENITRPRDINALPEEVIAELRVITVNKNSSMALVTAARGEIEPGDNAFARKGY